MNFTTDEKTMYKVMKAIYDSGIPIDFKGSMVLKACLKECGYSENVRHTVDIDANWHSDSFPTGEQMVKSLQNALNVNNIALDVSMYRMYGEGKSAGFDLKYKNSDEILFSMDIDVNRPKTATRLYEIDGFKFYGIAPVQMLADKVSVVSTDKVFRRVKDVIDLYYFSNAFEFNATKVVDALDESGRSLGDFNGFLYRIDDLEHAYGRFKVGDDVKKPDFDEMYCSVRDYIKDILPTGKPRELECTFDDNQGGDRGR